MTRQEMFDKVVNHLLTQNKRCSVEDVYYTNGLKCLYRGSSGLKCAIGCLIPDDKYDPMMEGMVAYNLVEHYKLSEYVPDVNLANRLQEVHDNYEPEL